jgi:cytochrome c biogenesis protein CcdA
LSDVVRSVAVVANVNDYNQVPDADIGDGYFLVHFLCFMSNVHGSLNEKLNSSAGAVLYFIFYYFLAVILPHFFPPQHNICSYDFIIIVIVIGGTHFFQ